jgi:hypothetical protein
MGFPDDPLILAVTLATLLIIALLGCLPAIMRVVSIRRLERLLGNAYWHFMFALDQWSRRHGK